MGLLGLDSGFFLADRIFQVMDVDHDGFVRFNQAKTSTVRLLWMTTYVTLIYWLMELKRKRTELPLV
jgi:hypothetical protein